MLGAVAFLLFFVLLAPTPRAFLGMVLYDAGTHIVAWAPFSYILIAILLVAPFVSVSIMRNWPAHVEPENPMAKYRKEQPFED
jgi:hypothetical protein